MNLKLFEEEDKDWVRKVASSLEEKIYYKKRKF